MTHTQEHTQSLKDLTELSTPTLFPEPLMEDTQEKPDASISEIPPTHASSHNEREDNTHTNTNPTDDSLHTAPSSLLDQNGQFSPEWWSQLPSLQQLGKTLQKFKSPEALAKSYTELEKMRQYPDPHDEEKLQAFRQFMGLPESAEEYTIQTPELPEELKCYWDNETIHHLTKTAHKYAIPATAFEALAKELTQTQIKQVKEQLSAVEESQHQQQENFRKQLQERWGAQCDTKIKGATTVLNQICQEAQIDASQLMENPQIATQPAFIQLLDHIKSSLSDSSLKGTNNSSISTSRAEAHRMESDPQHPLHDAYMNYKHPNHKYANSLYDKLITGQS